MQVRESGVYMTRTPRFKPSRDRRVTTVGVVPCPTCNAGIDDPCVKQDGSPSLAKHAARRRLAIRMENLAKEAQHD